MFFSSDYIDFFVPVVRVIFSNHKTLREFATMYIVLIVSRGKTPFVSSTSNQASELVRNTEPGLRG